jgi:hypothetical protein
MHFVARTFALLALLAPIIAVVAETVPAVAASVTWPESNPFQHVTNGERNALTIVAENVAASNITLVGVSGSFHNPDTGKVLKNLTLTSYNVRLVEKAKVSLPYSFHSEFRTGDIQLKLWVEYTVGDDKKTKFRADAFESTVAVVEPAASFFDIQMILTYLITLATLGAGGYFAYTQYFPEATKKTPGGKKIKSVAVTEEPTDPAPVKGSGVYSNDWIPEHHLRKSKSKGALSSGDEGASSGGERRRSTRRK